MKIVFQSLQTALLFAPFTLLALPSAPQVIVGTANVNTVGNTMYVNASYQATIQWGDVSLQENESIVIDSQEITCQMSSLTMAGLITNTGNLTIEAENSIVIAEEGTISAFELSLQAPQISCQGNLETNGPSMFLDAEKVALQNNASLSTTPNDNQGKIYIGGQKNQTTSISVDKGVNLTADAVSEGNGGHVMLVSEENCTFLGTLSAKGAGNGSGGIAEISGKASFTFDGEVNLSSPSGLSGKLLLDPISITISAINPNIDGLGEGHDITKVDQLDSPEKYPSVNSIITAGALNKLLQGNVQLTLAAFDSITVDAPIIASGTISELILDAPSINLNAPITLPYGGTLGGNGYIVNVGPDGNIQNGIDVATDNASVNLATGTYQQEVSIIGKSLSLMGSGIGSTIVTSPQTLTNSFTTQDMATYMPIIMVQGSQDVSIGNLTIDGSTINDSGNTIFTGIGYYNAGGMIASCSINHIENTATGSGIALVVIIDSGNYPFQVIGTQINHFYKGAINVAGAGMSCKISGNIIEGKNEPSDAIPYGIQIQSGATATISTNQVGGILSTELAQPSIGILSLYGGNTLSIIGNTVKHCDIGIATYNTQSQNISNNNSSHNRSIGIIIDAPNGASWLSGNTLMSNASLGMYLISQDNSSFSLAGNDFAACPQGLLVEGIATNGPQITMDSDTFTSIGLTYIAMNACPNNVWPSTQSVTFDGLTCQEMSYEQFLNLLEYIIDQHNDPTLGLVVSYE